MSGTRDVQTDNQLTRSVKQVEEEKESKRNRRNAGLLLFISGMEFLLVVMVGEATYPGYSVHTNTISDLGALGTSTALFYEPAILIWGLTWLLGAYFLFRNKKGKRGLLALNLLPGIGILVVALAPENVNVAIHSVGTIIAVFSGAFVAILSYRMVRSPLRYILLFLGILSLLGIVVEFGAYYSPLVSETLGPGGWERVIAYPLLIWQMGFGSFLLTSAEDNK